MLRLKRRPHNNAGSNRNAAPGATAAQSQHAKGAVAESEGHSGAMNPSPNVVQPKPNQPTRPSESPPPLKVDYSLHPQVERMARRYIFEEMPINLLHLATKKILNQYAIWSHVQSALKDIKQVDIPSNLRYPGEDPDLADVVTFIDGLLKWAIFSHRWGESEPTHQDVMENRLTTKPGHLKLEKLCKTAHELHGAQFVWSDTCCIDKENKVEYATSIRSMYKWYANAPLCIVHLAETTSIDNFENDPWFTRGWTLQELLAPKKLKFYDKDWRPLTTDPNDKESSRIAKHVESAASITPQDFRHFVPADRREGKYEISKRMRWAARRETTVPEDRAYCLMGIFNVSMYPDPGEGQERAVGRLMKEILRFSNSPEVLNWVGTPGRSESSRSRAFPSLIDCFNGSNDTGTIIRNDPDETALLMTGRGLEVYLLVFTAKLVSPGKPRATSVFQTDGSEVTVDVLDHDDLQGDGNEYAFGVWNFNSFPAECVPTGPTFEALLLKRQANATGLMKVWEKIPTRGFLRLEGMKKPSSEEGWATLRQITFV